MIHAKICRTKCLLEPSPLRVRKFPSTKITRYTVRHCGVDIVLPVSSFNDIDKLYNHCTTYSTGGGGGGGGGGLVVASCCGGTVGLAYSLVAMVIATLTASLFNH